MYSANRCGAHSLDSKIPLAFEIIYFSLNMLEWDHCNNVRDPFCIDDSGSRSAKVRAYMKRSIGIFEYLRISIAKHLNGGQGILQGSFSDKEEV